MHELFLAHVWLLASCFLMIFSLFGDVVFTFGVVEEMSEEYFFLVWWHLRAVVGGIMFYEIFLAFSDLSLSHICTSLKAIKLCRQWIASK